MKKLILVLATMLVLASVGSVKADGPQGAIAQAPSNQEIIT